mmetsp:Transcript_25028/g.35056  ORF Transcript_25028/g.35056 Transcript_25028/m.35056 type:complete len:118 (-) Transcript_25028:416-769(-)
MISSSKNHVVVDEEDQQHRASERITTIKTNHKDLHEVDSKATEEAQIVKNLKGKGALFKSHKHREMKHPTQMEYGNMICLSNFNKKNKIKTSKEGAQITTTFPQMQLDLGEKFWLRI